MEIIVLFTELCLHQILYKIFSTSYKDIAKLLDNPQAVRAVGTANRKNPLPIFIPCHRVVASNGRLTGFNGGLEAKEYLLSLEGMAINSNVEDLANATVMPGAEASSQEFLLAVD